MMLTVLGSSGSVPGPANPCSGYLVEHEGYRLLLDLGTGAFGALLSHAEPDEVDAVVISHRHSDHLHDLAALAYAQEKLRRRATPTRVIAPAGTAALVRRAELLAFDDARQGALNLGPLRVRLAPVRHSVPAFAVRVEAGGRSLTYTGDSGPCRTLARLARGTALLLSEAALGPGQGAGGDAWHREHTAAGPHHLSAGDAGELAALAGAGVLALTHLRPWHDAGQALSAAAGTFAGPVLLARPGLRLSPGTAAGAPHSEEGT